MLSDGIKFPHWRRAPLRAINSAQQTSPFTMRRPGNIASLPEGIGPHLDRASVMTLHETELTMVNAAKYWRWLSRVLNLKSFTSSCLLYQDV